jgi:hypothetical protein
LLLIEEKLCSGIVSGDNFWYIDLSLWYRLLVFGLASGDKRSSKPSTIILSLFFRPNKTFQQALFVDALSYRMI